MRLFRRAIVPALVVVACLAGVLVAPARAAGAAPANDAFAAAEVVSGALPLTMAGSNVGATGEPGEPNHGYDPTAPEHASVWYRWTATVSGRVAFDACGSTFDARVAVYTGSAIHALSAQASNDDGCGAQDPGRVAVDVTAGVAYSIAVDGYFDPSASLSVAQGSIRLTIRPAATPAGDAVDDPIPVGSSLPVAVTATNVDATVEAGEPHHADMGGPAPSYDSYGTSVWFRWTPTTTEPVALDLCASGIDTVAAVYRGTGMDDLAPVARAQFACRPTSPALRFDATAGEPLLLAVDGFAGQQGDIVLSLHSVANEDPAAATELGADLPVGVSGDTGGTTGGTSWYSWRPTASGPVVFDTCGSAFDTTLAVYLDASFGLGGVGSNDDGGCAPGSTVAASVRAGSRYLVAVGGVGGARGAFTLAIAAASGSPANDDFADARALPTTLPSATAASNVGATLETDEPSAAGAPGGGSVWFRWTAPADGPVSVGTCTAPTIDTVLAVFEGATLAGLAPVAADDDSCGTASRVRFPAEAGHVYSIVVDGFAGGTGPFTLTLSADSRPANDDRADAEALPAALPSQTIGTNAGATAEPGEPGHHVSAAAASVWYRWTAPTSGVVVADTCSATAFDTVLSVYDADLVPVVANDDRCGTQSLVGFAATAGTTYWLSVDGYAGAEGTFTLSLASTTAPANDERDSAEALGGALPLEVHGTIADATAQPGEPDHDTRRAQASVWYRWTAPSDGPVALAVCAPFPAFVTVTAAEPEPWAPELTAAGRCEQGREATFDAHAGTTYVFVVDGFAEQGPTGAGDFSLRLRPASPPPNDDRADAAPLTGDLPLAASGSNVDATNPPGEQFDPDVPGGATVWYRWTAPSTTGVVVDTCGSDFDTQLAVFAGDDPATATAVGAGNDGEDCGGHSIFADQASVPFRAAAGTTYWIGVGGSEGARGTVGLRLRPTAANDYFADAQLLDGPLPITTDVPPAVLTFEPGSNGDTGRWYRWTPTSSGRVVVDACGWSDDTEVAVYTGADLATLAPVARSIDACGAGAAATFDAVAGTAYAIAIGGGSGGPLTIRAAVARPANDDFAAARALSGPLPIVVHDSSVGATREAGEPAHSTFLGDGPSLWYRWTAPSTGDVAVETVGSTRPIAVAVYTGDDLVHLARQGIDDHDAVELHAIAGTTYDIAIARGAGYETSAVVLTLRRARRPANDDFEHATGLASSLPVTASGSNVDATRQGITIAGEDPTTAGHSVWFDWTADASGPVVLETCGSRIPTPDTEGRLTPALAEVFTGTVDDLRRVPGTADHQYCDGGTTSTFTAAAHSTYHLSVDSEGEGTGAIRLRLRRPHAPANDAFADATVLPSRLPVSVAGTNRDATREVGEPDHSGTAADDDVGLASVWYRWTAPADGPVVVETCGSAVDARLRVYTGSALTALAPVAPGHDTPRACGTSGSASSRMPRFDALAGTTYSIAVYGTSVDLGLGEPQGGVRLTIRPATPPRNDAFATPIVLSGRLPIRTDASLVDATTEPGERGFAGTVHAPSVWFTWTAPSAGPVVVDTCGSQFHSVVEVSTGASVDVQQPVEGTPRDCGDQGLVRIDAHAGTTYRIAVSGTIDQGPIRLLLRRPQAPPNDDVAAARTVTGAGSVAQSDRDATAAAGEPVLDAHATGATLWYRWTAPATGTAAFDTCGSAVPSVVAVFRPATAGGPQRVATGSEACGGRSRVALPVHRGDTFLVAVDGRGGQAGSISLRFDVDRLHSP